MNTPMSLRRTLLLGILLPLFAFVVINTVVLYRQALAAADTAYDRTLLATAKSLSEQLSVIGDGPQARVSSSLLYSALEAFEADNRSRMVYRVDGFAGEQVSGYPELDEADANAVYEAIMDPDKSLAYMAAAIRMSIDDYKRIAGMDISENPGITATLYNVGNPLQRAYALARKNKDRAASGQPPILPEENYYGWLINDKIAELKSLL